MCLRDSPEIDRAIPYPRGPFDCDTLGIEPRGRAPHLGEHTETILAQDIGMSADEIAALRATGAAR